MDVLQPRLLVAGPCEGTTWMQGLARQLMWLHGYPVYGYDGSGLREEEGFRETHTLEQLLYTTTRVPGQHHASEMLAFHVDSPFRRLEAVRFGHRC